MIENNNNININSINNNKTNNKSNNNNNNNLNFIKMIEDIKEEKLKRYLDNDVENLKKVQHLYQDISQKMIVQQDECRLELELWRNESIQFEKSIPTPEDEEEHIEKINDLENIKCQLIEENTKVEEAINYFENELSLIRSKKDELILKENQLSIENTHLIPDKEYLTSLYTNITGIKWSNLNNNNNNNNNNNEQQQQTNQPQPQQQLQQQQNSLTQQFIKGVIFDTQSFGHQQNSGQKIKPFSIDRNQYTNDFDVVNKIWDLLDDK